MLYTDEAAWRDHFAVVRAFDKLLYDMQCLQKEKAKAQVVPDGLTLEDIATTRVLLRVKEGRYGRGEYDPERITLIRQVNRERYECLYGAGSTGTDTGKNTRGKK